MLDVNNICYQNVEKMYDQRSSILFKGHYLDNFYVIKCYKKNYKNRWKNDLKILKSLSSCKNIIELKNYSSEIKINNILYYPIVTEYAEHGDLFEFVCKYSGSINKDIVIDVFSQIVSGIYYLNHKGWAHRDLKLENILVKNLYPIEIKIIDFEYSTSQIISEKRVGTASYMSPQLLMYQSYNTMKNDIWCLSIILFLLYTGKRPYDDISSNTNKICKWLKAIKNKEWAYYWDLIEKSCENKIHKSLFDKNNFFDSNFKNLIEKMLCWNEDRRIGIKQVVKHKFLNPLGINIASHSSCLGCNLV